MGLVDYSKHLQRAPVRHPPLILILSALKANQWAPSKPFLVHALPVDTNPWKATLQSPFYSHLIDIPSLSHLDTTAVLDALWSGHLYLGCDGSYDPSAVRAPFGVVLASESLLFLRLAGPCLGYSSQLSALQGELSSIIVSLHILHTRCHSTTSLRISLSLQLLRNGYKVNQLIIPEFQMVLSR